MKIWYALCLIIDIAIISCFLIDLYENEFPRLPHSRVLPQLIFIYSYDLNHSGLKERGYRIN